MDPTDTQSSSRNQSTSGCATMQVRIDLLLTSIVAALVVIGVMMSVIASKDKEVRMLRYEEQLYVESITQNWKATDIMMRHVERLSDELGVLRARDQER